MPIRYYGGNLRPSIPLVSEGWEWHGLIFVENVSERFLLHDALNLPDAKFHAAQPEHRRCMAALF